MRQIFVAIEAPRRTQKTSHRCENHSKADLLSVPVLEQGPLGRRKAVVFAHSSPGTFWELYIDSFPRSVPRIGYDAFDVACLLESRLRLLETCHRKCVGSDGFTINHYQISSCTFKGASVNAR